MFLGREIRSRGSFLADGEMERQARETLASLSVRTVSSVRQLVANLSGGQRQTVAIAKAVLWNSKVVFLDEPTAALGVAQTRQVLDLVRRLADQGRGVVLISHNMNDVMEVADRVVALYLGRVAAEVKATRQQHDPDRRADHRRSQRRHRAGTAPPPTRASERPAMTSNTPETNVAADARPADERPAGSPSTSRSAPSATPSRGWIGKLRTGDPGALPSVLGLIVLALIFIAGHRPLPLGVQHRQPPRAGRLHRRDRAGAGLRAAARRDRPVGRHGGRHLRGLRRRRRSSPATCTTDCPTLLYWCLLVGMVAGHRARGVAQGVDRRGRGARSGWC